MSVCPGQRWINHARPELGLGMVTAVDERTVTLRFGDHDHDHVFAVESAPLSRIRFSPGDILRGDFGELCVVDAVEEVDGILIYLGHDEAGARLQLVETRVAPSQSFNRPLERLLHGHLDDDRWFALRYRTMERRIAHTGNPLWGLLGARTALLRHQLYVAFEVARRHAPRVLLADEVGLGKTIEAGLIAHYQLVNERIRRVLVVVPDSLVHQWLVEMLRRFNLLFSVYDEERCAALAAERADDPSPGADNPFLDAQLVLTSREFLAEPERLRQCCEAGWDLLVMDEAHHLHWSETGVSEGYRVAESLAAHSAGVLLLTGTPSQLGLAGHFARLRLLDPDRYFDAARLEAEQARFAPVAELVETLAEGRQPSAEAQRELDHLGLSEAEQAALLAEPGGREVLIDRLLDRVGTGRVMFRNTRASVGGFPRRVLELHTLGDVDTRLSWLEGWLRDRPGEKALVICAAADVAAGAVEYLRVHAGIDCAAFHEGMGLVERDRAAAWFADPEGGCRALICSEIGSEGRNFQFAAHLVLYDLPPSADLLEQRIGRLDRIGRAGDVPIHVPIEPGGAAHRLFRWYHEGLDAFERIGTVNQIVHSRFSERLGSVVADGGDIDALIADARELRMRLETEMRAGRDRLLEYNSCRPGAADRLLERCEAHEDDRSLRDWLDLVGACHDVSWEPYRHNSVLFKAGPRLHTPIPGLPEEGLRATFDRATALENEDIDYLTWEHPMVANLADLVLNTERGNAAFCGIKHGALPRGRLAVECVFVVEPALTPRSGGGYVPPLQHPLVIDERLETLSPGLDHDTISAGWVPLKHKVCRQIVAMKRDALKDMAEAARRQVQSLAGDMLRAHARPGVERLVAERDRLRYLSSINPNVRQDEVEHLQGQLADLEIALDEARVRLDALRVVVGL